MITIYLMTGTEVKEIEAPAEKLWMIEDYMDRIGAIALGEGVWSIEGFRA